MATVKHKLHLIYTPDAEVFMPVIKIIPTIPAHLRELAENLRKEDEDEILSFGFTPAQALWRSYKASLFTKTAFVDGKLAAVWGVCGKFMGAIGQPWLLTTDAVYEVSPLKFARVYQQEVKEMLKMFPKLENYVIASYSSATRLLEIIGFKLGEPELIGTSKEMFRKFTKAAI